MGCCSYITAGLLPGISSTLGISVVAAGQGISAFGVSYIICAPLFAVVLAKKSARVILMLALTIFSIGNLVTLFSENLAVYLFGRAIAGIGAGLYSPICVAAAVQMIGGEARGRALSLIWGANSAGAVIGVPVGLWLSQKFGWQYAICLILLFSLITLLGISSQKLDLCVKAPPSLRERLRLLVDRRILSVIGVTILTATASLGLYTYMAPMHTSVGNSNSLTSKFFVWSLGGLIGSTAVGYIVDRVGQASFVMAVILTILIATMLLLPSTSFIPYLGLLPFLVWGAMGWATVTPQQHSLIGFQPEQSATLAALNGSAISLGSVLGTSIGGFAIANGLDVRNLPYAGASLLLGALLWQMFLIKEYHQEK